MNYDSVVLKIPINMTNKQAIEHLLIQFLSAQNIDMSKINRLFN